MKQHEISSTDDLHQIIWDHGHGHFLLRGEDSPSYQLRPKFGRFQSRDSRNSQGIERALLADFKRRSSPMLQHAPENDWEWLAVAQHFGLATRLLDWTENPLVAAFFAVKGPAVSENGRAIYFLDATRMPDADESKSPFDISEVVLYRPKHIASRIASQGGVFTVHSAPADPLDDDRVEKWIINPDCVPAVYRLLWSYKINDSFVFPDLDGLARFLNIKYVWGAVG